MVGKRPATLRALLLRRASRTSPMGEAEAAAAVAAAQLGAPAGVAAAAQLGAAAAVAAAQRSLPGSR